jgi:hypothetical protein
VSLPLPRTTVFSFFPSDFSSLFWMDYRCLARTSNSERLPEVGRLRSEILSSPKAAKRGLLASLKFCLKVSSFLARRSVKAVRSCSPNWLFLLEEARREQELVMARYLSDRLIHFLD